MRGGLGAAVSLSAGVDPLGGDQELDIVNIGHFRRAHQAQYEREDQHKSTA
jgi:hypothetical protein